MSPRTALAIAGLLAALLAALTHVYARSDSATLTLNPVGLLAGGLAVAVIAFAEYAWFTHRDVAAPARTAGLVAVAAFLVAGVAFLASLLLVPEDSRAAAFIGYGVSPGGWIAAILMWPLLAPWLLACAGGVAPCP